MLLNPILGALLHHKVGCQTEEDGLEEMSRDGVIFRSPLLPTQ